MNTNDFDFELPEELIAQTPLKQRDASKLLVIDPVTKEMTDTTSTTSSISLTLAMPWS